MAPTKSEWLVKSGGRVLGPYSKSEIAGLLKSREVTLLDEAATPLRRWMSIQDHEGLREIVEQYRSQNVSDKTELTWGSAATTNLTQTLTDHSGGEITQEINSDLNSFTSSQNEIVIHNIQEQSHISQNAGAGRFQPSVRSNAAIQQQIEKTTRRLWLVTGLVLLIVLGYLFQKHRGNSPEARKELVGDLTTRVTQAMQIGDYSEALRQMKSEISDVKQAEDLAIHYGSLLVQVEEQTVLGRRFLEPIVNEKQPQAKLAQTSLGVADLIDNQLESAHKHFSAVLTADTEYVPALINMGFLYLMQGNPKRAKVLAERILSINPKQGEALMILAEAQLKLQAQSPDKGELEQVRRRIENYLKSQWDFVNEIGLYHLAFLKILEEKSWLEGLRSYLDRDPELTRLHRHSIFVYQGKMRWDALLSTCESLAKNSGDEPLVSTLLASCYMRAQNDREARTRIEKAVNQSPKDPLLQGWLSVVLNEGKDAEQASVVLGRAVEFNRKNEFRLPNLLQARFCQRQGDLECSRSTWQKLYENNRDDLTAIAGMAWVYAQEKSHREASSLIERGLKISAEYIPLLELRQKGEMEGWFDN